MRLIPTILCGGAGSRLWPVSRELHPKPFIRLPDGQSLLQKAFLRGVHLPGVSDCLMVTNEALLFKIEDDLLELEKQNITTSFILEPMGRNTAPAIAVAALKCLQQYGEDVMLCVLSADHLITQQDAFEQAILNAIPLALQENLVTLGISPHEPNTGYGYIEAEGHDVLRFVEKPSFNQALEYMTSGRFLWNAGLFVLTAKTVLAAMEEHCPDLLLQAKISFEHAQQTKKGLVTRLDATFFYKVPDISIDYALMEKSKRVKVIACDMGWTDVGSWAVLSDLVKADAEGNRVEGEALLHDVSNCYIQSHDRLVGAVGVKDLVIIDTPDALLVANKSSTQEVKHLYQQLKAKNHDVHKVHRTVHRPWGHYTVLEESARYKIKRIQVKPGACLSLQMHHHRSEHWIVVSGMAEVTRGEDVFFLRINESTYIPAGCLHRLFNPGLLDLMMIEVQSGDYLGEDDIVRFEDNYGRVTQQELCVE